MAKVTMPQLGESVAEGTIGRWLKKPGDHVAKYEPLVEVITDKVNAEVPSPFEGTLIEILVEEGATVPNDAEIAVIATADEPALAGAAPVVAAAPVAVPIAASAPVGAPAGGRAAAAASSGTRAAAAASSGPAAAASSGPAAAASSGPAAATVIAPPPAAPSTASPNGSESSVNGAASHALPAGNPDARMTPAVRRLLREHGLAAAQVVGTGGGGRITRDDVQAVVEAIRTGAVPAAVTGGPAAPAPPLPTAPASPTTRSTASTPAAGGPDEELVPLTQLRKGIAAQMTRALAVPHAYLTLECDMTGVVRVRDRIKAEFQAREGVTLSFVPFVVKAVVEALRSHPDLNAHWTDQGLLRKRRINVGVAIAVDNGLIVPVIHDADQLSISGLNRAINDLATRARSNKLRLDDLQGGTFTVDNTGSIGAVSTQPIINVPEVAILTMESIVKRPVVRDTPDGETIAIRSIMNVCCALDHRATDGAQVGRFMQDVVRWLQAVGPETPIY